MQLTYRNKVQLIVGGVVAVVAIAGGAAAATVASSGGSSHPHRAAAVRPPASSSTSTSTTTTLAPSTTTTSTTAPATTAPPTTAAPPATTAAPLPAVPTVAANASDVDVAKAFVTAFANQDVSSESPAALAQRVAPLTTPAYDTQLASINSGGGSGTTQATVLTATEIQPGDVNLDVSISDAGQTTQEAWTVQLVPHGASWLVNSSTVN